MLERMNVRVDGSRCWSGWRPAVHKPGPLISTQTAFRKLRACDSGSRYWLVYLSRIYRGLTTVDLLTIRYRVPLKRSHFSIDSSLSMLEKILLLPIGIIHRLLSSGPTFLFTVTLRKLNNSINERSKNVSYGGQYEALWEIQFSVWTMFTRWIDLWCFSFLCFANCDWF